MLIDALLLIIINLLLLSCRPREIKDDFLLFKRRFDDISNLSLDTIFLKNDTVNLCYTDHSGYYDPFSIDEQFMYLIMMNEDYLRNKIISYMICLEGSSENEPSIFKGSCLYQQISSTSAYEAFISSSFYRQVLKRLYCSEYYPYHFLMLNWNYGYELSLIKDPGKFYNANSTELIRNFIINKSLCDPTIDSIWYHILEKEMKINSIYPEFDKEKKDLLISITNYRSEDNS